VQSWITVLRTFVLANAATATTKGVDASFTARVAPGLTLSGSATYADASTTFPRRAVLPGADRRLSATQFVQCGGVSDSTLGQFSTSLGADYQHALTNTLDGLVSLSYYHRSSLSAGFGPAFQIELGYAGCQPGPQGGKLDAVGVLQELHQCHPPDLDRFGRRRCVAEPGRADAQPRFSFNSVRTIGVRAGINF
jgi:iron complex outermembrane receptor protein